ncbi:MAG: acetate/propionate family kinase [Betaproteobacteria bacterium]|nr:acetate/propionate family kinase [Betaproteobacteria bacterium]
MNASRQLHDPGRSPRPERIAQGRHVLTLNAGSSSLKAGLHRADGDEALVLAVDVDRIGGASGRLRVRAADGGVITERTGNLFDHRSALAALFTALAGHAGKDAVAAVGHRVVHGGPRYTQPQWVSPELVATLRELVPLDPTHMPQVLQGIDYVGAHHPALPQAACFDTTFHRGMPGIAQILPLPRWFHQEGMERFGFHGLSYDFVTGELRRLDPAAAAGRVVVAHLGNGASMAAIAGGRSIDTTMGFTPTSGLLMGTRCGDIDPGVLIYLLEQRNMTPRELNMLLDDQAGLLGISGTSADMRDLLAAEAADPRAADAIALFCYRAKKYLGAFASALGGLDALVFTGGIGEKAAVIRERICAGQGFLGIALDPDANQAHAPVISRPGGAVTVRVIPTNEERIIARDTIRLLRAQPAGRAQGETHD